MKEKDQLAFQRGRSNAKACALAQGTILMLLAWSLWLTINIGNHIAQSKRFEELLSKESMDGSSSVDLIKASAAVVTAQHHAMLSASVLVVLGAVATKSIRTAVTLGLGFIILWFGITAVLSK